jgi:hypothetical protein
VHAFRGIRLYGHRQLATKFGKILYKCTHFLVVAIINTCDKTCIVIASQAALETTRKTKRPSTTTYVADLA